MGSAQASGEHRSLRAVEQAMASPLLNDSNIKGARYVLVNVTCGEDEITMDELGEITDYIQDAAGMTAEVIKGYGVDPSLGDKVNVTIIATGFNSKADVGIQFEKAPERKVFSLMDEPKKVEAPIVNETPKMDEIVSFIKGEEITPVAEEIVVIVDEVAPVAENTEEVSSTEPFMFVREEVKEEIISNEESQVTFEFEIANNSNVSIDEAVEMTQMNEEPVMKSEPVIESRQENVIVAKVEEDEQLKKAQERVAKLKELSFKLKSPNGLSELENEPAYKRRNINLDSTPHSSESQVSRYTLSEGDDKKAEIKPNNSFLHDNVD
jgi:cell division protein FtsZ